MPRAGAFVHKRTQTNDFAVDVAGQGQAGTADGNHGGNQDGKLRVQRNTVFVTELVINTVGIIRNLVAMKALNGNGIAVINHHPVAGFQFLERVGVGCTTVFGVQLHYTALNGVDVHFCTGSSTGQHAETAVILIRTLRQRIPDGDGGQRFTVQHGVDPAVVYTGCVLFCSGFLIENGFHKGGVLQAAFRLAAGGVGTFVAVLFPEVLEIGGEHLINGWNKHHKGAVSHLAVHEPCLLGEAHGGKFPHSLLLLVVQTGVQILASAGFRGSGDFFQPLFAEKAHGTHTRSKYIGGGHGVGHHIGNGTVPHALGCLHAAHCFEGTAAAAEHIAIRACLGGIQLLGYLAGKFGGLRAGLVQTTGVTAD